jgi:DNA-binding NarL/FixJ family response regulator
MSGSADPDGVLVQALSAGAIGFLSKTEPASAILRAIRAAARGTSLVDTAMLDAVHGRVTIEKERRRIVERRTTRLTDREREVLQHVSEGKSDDEIAKSLFLSVHTVRTHVRNILIKLEVHSKLQAVALAVKTGAVTVKR